MIYSRGLMGTCKPLLRRSYGIDTRNQSMAMKNNFGFSTQLPISFLDQAYSDIESVNKLAEWDTVNK